MLTRALGLILALGIGLASSRAWAWGDEGHEVIALIAQHYLPPASAQQVSALLAADTDTLTAPDIASRATWADKYRQFSSQGRQRTSSWHFVDLEITGPDLTTACFGRPPLNGPASTGPARDCVVDKIDEFSDELARLKVTTPERVLALKYLLHFVGDVHQPLHAADDHDRGGNEVKVRPTQGRTTNLHAYWDTGVVRALGSNPTLVASGLILKFGAQRQAWMAGKPEDWAMESFGIAKGVVYRLPEGSVPVQLNAEYEAQAESIAAEQLAKAGMRLAMLLNEDLR